MTDDYVIRANIERFSKLLITCTDETLRRTLNVLLAEQNENLKRLEAAKFLLSDAPVRPVLPKT
jgi:hypothetical protein